MLEKNNPKVENGWAFYDWANSVYNLVITSAVFPIYFEAVAWHRKLPTEGGKEIKYLSAFGREFVNMELYSYVFSVSFVLVTLLIPLLSGIADYSGSKKRFMQFFCYLGSAACISLFWFDTNNIELSLISPFLASIGFWGSLVFYNSYLPEISTPDRQDRLSAKGFAFGYVGSVILLVAILVGNQMFDMPIKYGFVAVGIWWAGFAQITYSRLPHNIYNKKPDPNFSYIKKGYQELMSVAKEVRKQPRLVRFLTAFFIYNMGVQTIMLLAGVFAVEEILWPLKEDGTKDTSGLIISIILIQLVAVLGAMLMSRLSRKVGNISVIKLAIVIWLIVCILAYFTYSPAAFYALAALVGFVMGGIQSMSRSTYSKMLPETTDHASYFSFYDVLEKIGLIIGPFLFGFTTGQLGGMRNAVLILASIFVIGYILMIPVSILERKLSASS
ncbi:MAG: MFS transporter [Bacteroidetes bacterium]|nr:MFS transporter [Bacteroidota bacterium]